MNIPKNNRINRPALRYYGGKWKLASWITNFFPEHSTYVEPFGGAASILLNKKPSFIEVYNDLNKDVVNFFEVLRERPEALITAIELTPYSRYEFLQSQKPCDDNLENARRFFIWSWQGRGRGGVVEPGGWRFMSRRTRSKTPVDDWNNINHLWAVAERLKQVHIECDDALKVIARFDNPDTLFYVDPPYVQSTRCNRWKRNGYRFEYEDNSHRQLAEALRSIQGMAIVSGYPSDLYDQLYGDWKCLQKTATKDSAKKAIECLWFSKNFLTKEKQPFLLMEAAVPAD